MIRSDSFIVTLTEVMMSDSSLCIDEVERRPVLIVESTPDRIVTVDGNRVVDFLLGHGSADTVNVLLKAELRCVNADNHQPLILVLPCPRTNVGKRAPPVDAGVSPELDQDHFAAQLGRTEWLRIQPSVRALERGQLGLTAGRANGEPVKERNLCTPVDVMGCPFMSPTNPASGAPIAVASTAATRSLLVFIGKSPSRFRSMLRRLPGAGAHDALHPMPGGLRAGGVNGPFQAL